MAGHRIGEVEQRELWRTLLAGQVTEAERPGQTGVAGRPVGEHQQVLAVRIGRVACRAPARWPPAAGCRPRCATWRRDRAAVAGGEGDLGAEHRGQADRACRLGEAHHAVEPVVIGERQRLETQPGGLLRQLLGVRGAVEEREVGVAVQLGVGHVAGESGRMSGRVLSGRRAASYGWRLRLHAGPSPPAFHDGDPGRGRPCRAAWPTIGEQRSTSLHGMSGLLKPIGDRDRIEHVFVIHKSRE